jgi:hypothetical protein
VIPWSLLDKAQVPGGGELRLMQRGAEFSIRLGHNELMNSRVSGSEGALATIACERIQAHPRPQILIGGLGMGFTLRAALAVLGTEARILVAELVPAVLKWVWEVEIRCDLARCRQRARGTDPRRQRRALQSGRIERRPRDAAPRRHIGGVVIGAGPEFHAATSQGWFRSG